MAWDRRKVVVSLQGVSAMPKSVAELEQEANRLSKKDRAALAHHLIASIDPGEEMDAEAVWLEEAERRYQAYRQGKLAGRPAEQVFRQARSKLR
ncbi:MAG: addiction module antitoxin RelB [Nitrospira sp. LK70]|nr:addiction module antitoxin RelB [Nitrospira sp. LK70]